MGDATVGGGVQPIHSVGDTEDLFRLLVESVNDYAIFMLDPTGIIRTWNPGAERLKGYAAKDIIGQHFSIFYTPSDRSAEKPQRGLKRALSEGRFEDEGWRVRSDGTLFWANVIITAVHDGRGVHRGFAKITRDLTERRKAEEERIRLAHAEEAVRLRDEFLSIAAHELRTPLNALQLQLATASMLFDPGRGAAPDPSDLARRLRGANRVAERLGTLITRLLDVSRVSMGRFVLDTNPMDLVASVKEVIASFQPRTKGREINFSGPSEAKGTWDKLRVEQVVYNLIDNALNHGGGSIDVSIEANDQVVTLDILDHGAGIAPEYRRRIFVERFIHDTPNMAGGGLGLGLYISHKIIGAHGGHIELRDSPGAGTNLHVSLPREARNSGDDNLRARDENESTGS
jgi:PAS domain S-box-containing protein